MYPSIRITALASMASFLAASFTTLVSHEPKHSTMDTSLLPMNHFLAGIWFLSSLSCVIYFRSPDLAPDHQADVQTRHLNVESASKRNLTNQQTFPNTL